MFLATPFFFFFWRLWPTIILWMHSIILYTQNLCPPEKALSQLQNSRMCYVSSLCLEEFTLLHYILITKFLTCEGSEHAKKIAQVHNTSALMTQLRASWAITLFYGVTILLHNSVKLWHHICIYIIYIYIYAQFFLCILGVLFQIPCKTTYFKHFNFIQSHKAKKSYIKSIIMKQSKHSSCYSH